MLCIASGASRTPEVREATREVTEQLARSLAGRPARAAVFFSTADHGPGYGQISRAIEQATGAEDVVGCSASGIVSREGGAQPGSGISALALAGDFEARRFFVPALRGRAELVGREVGRIAAGLEREPRSVLLFPDTYNLAPDELLAGIAETASDVTVVGAGASEDGSMGETIIVGRGTSSSNAICGLALGGITLRAMVSPVSVPMSSWWTITRAHTNRILELDGKPALDVFLAALPEVLRADLEQAVNVVQAALSDPDATSSAPPPHVLRPLLGADRSTDALLVGDEVRPGMRFSMAVRDPITARERLSEGLKELRDDSSPLAGVIYFHSALSGEPLYGLPDLDMAYLRHDLGEPELAGFSSYVLFAPHGGRNRFHHFSGVLVGFQAGSARDA